MNDPTATTAIRPPFKQAWVSQADLMLATVGNQNIYGVTSTGKVASLTAANGVVNWTTQSAYLRTKLTLSGNHLYAYVVNQGLAQLTDNGGSVTERLLLGINPLSENDQVSNVVIDGDKLYLTSDEALLALTQTGGFVATTSIGNQFPHVLAPTGSNRVAVIDGYGQVQLFQLSGSALQLIRYTQLSSPGTTQERRPVLVTSGRVISGANGQTICYDGATGDIVWQTAQVGAQALAENNGVVYALGFSGQLFALRVSDGGVIWRRMYLGAATVTDKAGLVYRDGILYATGYVASGGPLHFYAVDAATGAFLWQGNPTTGTYGFCTFAGDLLIPYGSSQPVAAMAALANPSATVDMFTWQPTPLRGARSGFSGSMTMSLPTRLTVSVAVYREREGIGYRLFAPASRQGDYQTNWDAGGVNGFSDIRQFGRLLIDIQEQDGTTYNIAKLLPVNTLPDIIGHWAQASIEAMLYNRYIGGYPDLTFRPDNLVTRAETSTIVAKTLGLEGPSPGFHTQFTDITTHWARNAIMALEERQIINGFQEADGTFTFRPELNMTRAQEARVLVKAYAIPAAPSGFQSRFTDIASHWARADIEALEAAGYVNGFREGDGSYTYRPEQNLTRAELCAMVVRIRNL